MEIRIENKRGGFPILWCGISTSLLWIDLDYWFSIDFGKWFLRLFLKFGDFRFCRYLGVIS